MALNRGSGGGEPRLGEFNVVVGLEAGDEVRRAERVAVFGGAAERDDFAFGLRLTKLLAPIGGGVAAGELVMIEKIG